MKFSYFNPAESSNGTSGRSGVEISEYENIIELKLLLEARRVGESLCGNCLILEGNSNPRGIFNEICRKLSSGGINSVKPWGKFAVVISCVGICRVNCSLKPALPSTELLNFPCKASTSIRTRIQILLRPWEIPRFPFSNEKKIHRSIKLPLTRLR
jgi:hypothetical protein